MFNRNGMREDFEYRQAAQADYQMEMRREMAHENDMDDYEFEDWSSEKVSPTLTRGQADKLGGFWWDKSRVEQVLSKAIVYEKRADYYWDMVK